MYSFPSRKYVNEKGELDLDMKLAVPKPVPNLDISFKD